MAVGTVMLFAFVDPLGLQAATAAITQDVFLLLVAPFYRLFDCPKSSPPITVLLIDEETINRLGTGFPLSDAQLLRALKRVVCKGAATVFVDILFGDPRPGGASIADSFLELASAGARAKDKDLGKSGEGSKICDGPMAPLYFADIPPEPAKDRSSLSESGDEFASGPVAPSLREVALRVPVSWHENAYAYPTRLKNLQASEEKGWQRLAGGTIATPAFQQFLDLTSGSQTVSPSDLERMPENFVLTWGWWSAERPDWYVALTNDVAEERTVPLCLIARPDLIPLPDNFIARVFVASAISIELAALRSVPKIREWCDIPEGTAYQPIISIPILPLWLFLQNGDQTYQNYLDQAVRGRAVLIGQNVAGAADIATSIVNGKIPGVVVHAQALDNLLNWRSHQWRASTSPRDASVFTWSYFPAVFAIFYLLLAETMTSLFEIRKIIQYIILTCTSLVVFVILTFGYNLAPINWLWVITLFTGGELLNVIEKAHAGNRLAKSKA